MDGGRSFSIPHTDADAGAAFEEWKMRRRILYFLFYNIQEKPGNAKTTCWLSHGPSSAIKDGKPREKSQIS